MQLAANEYKLYFPKGNPARFSGGEVNFEFSGGIQTCRRRG
jgi:hypothetical protein